MSAIALTLRRRRPSLAGYVFLLPWLLGFFGLTLGPALASLYLSFTSYDLIGTPHWIGLENYVRIMTADSKVADSVHVTLLYVALSVPLKLGFALAIEFPHSRYRLSYIVNGSLDGLQIPPGPVAQIGFRFK